MSSASSDSDGELLRSRGLRSTPQRRTILGVFRGGRTEHLSADEVYAKGVRELPELSRATVYATLAEFSELGLLSAFGTPEPVRYEMEVEPHAHLRCYVCLRLFDLPGVGPGPEDIDAPGFIIKSVETRVEGICDECVDYAAGLAAGARSMLKPGPTPEALQLTGSAAATLDGPLGPLLLAATSDGLFRVAFEDHHDADALKAHAASRRGSKAAHQHLAVAKETLLGYLAGDADIRGCPVDWQSVGSSPEALRATTAIPYGSHASYSDLALELSPRELGTTYGSNPIPIIMPCHRVLRGTEIPDSFVGGTTRRTWLDAHEQASPTA